MSIYLIRDTITGDRLKIDTYQHADAESIAQTIAAAFFPPLIDGEVPNPEGMREALHALASDMMTRQVGQRPGAAGYLALEVI